MAAHRLPALATLLAASFLIVPPLSGTARAAEPVTVLVANKSKTTTCAEEDNVNYIFSADHGMRGFKVATSLPPYMATIVQDYWAPDFSNCPDTPPAPPVKVYTPPAITLYEDGQILLKGLIDPRFWRPHKAQVRIDQIDWPFLDMVQLWKKTPSGYIEFLMFYPQDGYWRLKSLPPRRLPEVSYGSSFLLGPIEAVDTRPYVDYKRVSFDWKTLTFHIEFAKGGRAQVQVTGLGDEATSELSVTFDPPLPKGTPFASMRSMYVGPGNHDTEHVTVRPEPGAQPVRTPVMGFGSGQVNDIVFGRTELSKHNISAPDMRFFDFVK
jgi:hypothetical protein